MLLEDIDKEFLYLHVELFQVHVENILLIKNSSRLSIYIRQVLGMN